ncbi:MAG: HAMP domain-containing protein [Solirubrobacterales bacterium]|nr:HAMP domain-containing protein [Solirubrobacterales bacterium]
MIDRFLNHRFRLKGADYPFRAACWVLLGGHVIVALGVVLLAIQFEFDAWQFWSSLVLVEALTVVDNSFSAWRLKRALRKVHAVLSGESTDGESVRTAWLTLVNLPTLHLKRAIQRTAVGTMAPLVLWVAWQLDLPWWGAPLLFLVGIVILLYGFLLRFLILELAWRPAVAALAVKLPSEIERSEALASKQLSMRARLLLGIPLINVITGTVVATLSRQPGSSGLENIGADVIITTLVATTVSLGLSLLFSRSILMPISDIRQAAKLARAGDFAVRVPVMSTDEVGRLAIGFNNLMSGMEERQRLETALETFSDQSIVAAVKEVDSDKLSAQELDVTVMFIDILGFTEFAERTTPQAVVERLTEYFDIVVPALERHGGHANQMLADGLMAVFGAPDPLIGHPDRAVDAALEIVTLLKARFAGVMEVGVGINSGPVVSGAIGGGGSARFTVIGDTVNTAERVERATRTTGDAILISGATYSRLATDHGGFDERPAAPMKGKSTQVRLWAPRALSAVAGLGTMDLEDVAAGAPGPLMGDISVERTTPE